MEPFPGHCPFNVYMPKNPTKYGIKVYVLVDVTSNYIFNFEMYVGQQPEGNFRISNLSTDAIMWMIYSIRNSGKTVTVDSYFTSLSLFSAIKEHGLQAVGTINKNRTFIPPLFLATKTRQTKIDPHFRLYLDLAMLVCWWATVVQPSM